MCHSIQLQLVSGVYGVAQLPAKENIPEWFGGEGFSAAIRASDELTLICLQERIPDNVHAELNWRCFRSAGPFSFDTAGIVHSIIEPLTKGDIGVFVVCTFDGEHILVSNDDWNKSVTLLKQAGHSLLL